MISMRINFSHTAPWMTPPCEAVRLMVEGDDATQALRETRYGDKWRERKRLRGKVIRVGTRWNRAARRSNPEGYKQHLARLAGDTTPGPV